MVYWLLCRLSQFEVIQRTIGQQLGQLDQLLNPQRNMPHQCDEGIYPAGLPPVGAAEGCDLLIFHLRLKGLGKDRSLVALDSSYTTPTAPFITTPL
ncbi:hypothetical protein PFLU4_58430 [Pseudomonas fluorescens]|nr:hypothetical protein PFLU4_58430 [Pseudomonas fluorescens]